LNSRTAFKNATYFDDSQTTSCETGDGGQGFRNKAGVGWSWPHSS